MMNPAINVHKGVRKPDQNRDLTKDRKAQSFEETSKENDEKKPKKSKRPMATFLKIVLGLLTFIVLFIVAIVGFTFYAGSAVVSAVAENANKAVIQRIETNNGETTIYVPLQKEYGFVITGYQKCFNSTGRRNEPATSSSCINGNCEITVTIDTATIPDSVTLFVEQGNECQAKVFDVGDKVNVINYFAKIEMSEELLDTLDIGEEQYSVASLNSRGRHSYQMMGTKKVVLNYNTDVPYGDTLTIDEQNKASIVFE